MAAEPVPLHAGLARASGDSRVAKAMHQVAEDARYFSRALLREWLPGGQYLGFTYHAPNPLRWIGGPREIMVDPSTGRWGAYYTRDLSQAFGGEDLVGLLAYLNGTDRLTAMHTLAAKLSPQLLHQVHRAG